VRHNYYLHDNHSKDAEKQHMAKLWNSKQICGK
jgi:hypothetical protein